MRITAVRVYGYTLTYVHGRFVMSGERAVTALPSTVVCLETDQGLAGWGETCPLGPAYLPAFAEGARAALRELAPALLGLDPRQLNLVHAAMEATLRGHGYAKSAVDMACWDLLGRATGQPVATLLGGRLRDTLALYVAVPLGPPEAMAAHVRACRAEGYRRFQLKVGGDPREDAARVRAVVAATEDEDLIIADANAGWTFADAAVAVRQLEPLDRVFLEQPCPTLEQCLAVRRRTTLPMVLDECITDVRALLRAAGQGVEAVNLKINRVGGLTRARQLRDLAESLGVRVTVEDSWGGDVATAAIAQLAASTAPQTLFTVSFMNAWSREHIAGGEPRSDRGRGLVPQGPGLGVTVDESRLGTPLFTVP